MSPVSGPGSIRRVDVSRKGRIAAGKNGGDFGIAGSGDVTRHRSIRSRKERIDSRPIADISRPGLVAPGSRINISGQGGLFSREDSLDGGCVT